MAEYVHTKHGWTINSFRNSPSMIVKVKGKSIPCRILEQTITAPDGSQIRIEQHLSNVCDYHDIRTVVITNTSQQLKK